MRDQSGVTTVEFAIIAASLFMVVFAVIEFARVLYTWNTLNEVTRRGARVAVVCPVNHSAIQRVALLNGPGDAGGSAVVYGLTPEHIRVEYLDVLGGPIADPMAEFTSIRFVRVSVVDYRHEVLIPFMPAILTAPAVATVLPRESLGVPREGAGPECYGTAG